MCTQYFTMFALYLIFQINTDFLINQIKNQFFHKTPYTPLPFLNKIGVSIEEAFRNIYSLSHFYQLSQWMRCAMFQINTNLIVIQQNINIFTLKPFYIPPLFQKEIGTPHRKCFSKHPLSTTYLLVFTKHKVCNISNKYQPHDKLAKY